MINNMLCAFIAVSAAATVPLASVSAVEYPARPIRIVVPFPPGGGADVLARVVGQKVTENWGQQVVVDNRPGASGLVGADIVANSTPDGHTLLMTAAGGVTLKNINSFAPIVLVAAPPSVLVIHPSVRASNVKELIALARAQPGKLNFGSSGTGSTSHLAAELFNAMAKINVVHVPYKGAGQAVAELLGGQVQYMVAPIPAVQSHLKAGKLNALGVTSAQRFAPVSDLPTIAESGLPSYDAIGWFGLLTSVKVLRSIVSKLNAEVNRVLKLPDVKERLLTLGAEPAGGTPEQFAAHIRADAAKWDKLIRELGITIQ